MYLSWVEKPFVVWAFIKTKERNSEKKEQWEKEKEQWEKRIAYWLTL